MEWSESARQCMRSTPHPHPSLSSNILSVTPPSSSPPLVSHELGMAAVAGKKPQASAPPKDKKPRRKPRPYRWDRYIYPVLKQVHFDLGISKLGMNVAHAIIQEVFEQVGSEAATMVRKNKDQTLTSRTIQAAVRLVFPDELAKHAVSEGTKAVTKFNASKNGDADKGKKKSVSRSARAGLQFPVGRVASLIRKSKYAKRVGESAAVYLAGVLEYVAAEILELSGNAVKDLKRKRINPRAIMLAVRGDSDLNRLLRDVSFPQAGVIPHIQPQLLPKRKRKGSDDEADEDKKKKKKKKTGKTKASKGKEAEAEEGGEAVAEAGSSN